MSMLGAIDALSHVPQPPPRPISPTLSPTPPPPLSLSPPSQSPPPSPAQDRL